MADDHAMTKTRPSSFASPAESPESMGSTNRVVTASPPCYSDVSGPGPSRTGFAKKEFIMMAPEEKLKYFDSRAQDHEVNQEVCFDSSTSQPLNSSPVENDVALTCHSVPDAGRVLQFDACIQDLVRCVALTRLVYGDGHLKLAHAHARLAKAYFQFKGWGLQAQEHSALARELLPFCPSLSSCRDEKLEVLTCLLNIHLTQGGASLLTTNLKEAESSFLEAEQALERLHQQGGIGQEERIKTELEIYTGLCRVYRRQSRPEEALRQCEKSLQRLQDWGKPEKTCSVYRDMAAIEQDKGHLDRAIEHLSKAHAIAMSHSPEEREGAQISHSLALLLSAAAEPHHNDSAGRYFEQSLSIYKNCVGPHDPTFLAVQDDFCRFLLLSGQQERCVEIQRASLATKRSTFGDLSAEVADTLQLMGSIEMSEGRVKQAHRTMTKCLEIQSLLYSPQHRKTKASQRAVDMLARAPEVAERQQRQGSRKTKHHKLSAVPSSGNDGNSMSDS